MNRRGGHRRVRVAGQAFASGEKLLRRRPPAMALCRLLLAVRRHVVQQGFAVMHTGMVLEPAVPVTGSVRAGLRRSCPCRVRARIRADG
jgi:hypothetical protein